MTRVSKTGTFQNLNSYRTPYTRPGFNMGFISLSLLSLAPTIAIWFYKIGVIFTDMSYLILVFSSERVAHNSSHLLQFSLNMTHKSILQIQPLLSLAIPQYVMIYIISKNWNYFNRHVISKQFISTFFTFYGKKYD